MADQPSAQSSGEVRHAHHLATNGEDVPEDVAQAVMRYLDDVTTAASREELMEGLEAAYAAIGVWEEFLEANDAA